MLEIVFDDSAAAGLKLAQHYGKDKHLVAGAVSVIYAADGTDAPPPARAELAAAQRRAEEQERRRRERAVPLGGDPANVLGFSLELSSGPLDGGFDSDARLDYLTEIFCPPGDAESRGRMAAHLKQARKNLDRLLPAAKSGEPLRIWTDLSPEYACGLCWLMAQLQRTGADCPVTVIPLPLLEAGQDGTAVQYRGWGEVSPGEWHRFLPLERPLAPMARHVLAKTWRRLEQENAPLRAVVNGQLVSVREDSYDGFLLTALDGMGEFFRESELLGRMLAQYPRASGGAEYLHRRVDALLSAGLLEQLVPEEPGRPWSRVLRRAGE